MYHHRAVQAAVFLSLSKPPPNLYQKAGKEGGASTREARWPRLKTNSEGRGGLPSRWTILVCGALHGPFQRPSLARRAFSLAGPRCTARLGHVVQSFLCLFFFFLGLLLLVGWLHVVVWSAAQNAVGARESRSDYPVLGSVSFYSYSTPYSVPTYKKEQVDHA